ncbi:MAG: pyrroline-5-carboxylate reductase [Vescimonas sp.]
MKVGFIGTGNMGGALAHAAAQSPAPAELLLSNRTPEKAQALAQQLGATVSDNETIAQTCDYIFLGVKPQMMADLLARLRPILSRRQEGFVLVSMAAGLTLQRLREMAGLSCPILRIMPNTACAVGAGLTLYVPSPEVTEEQLSAFLTLMSASGRLEPLEEHLIDAGSAVAGCGGAFVSLFLEALADGAVTCGLPRDKARRYAAQMVLGTAQLALQSDQHTATMKDAVCSPGGTTIAGVRALERGGFRSAAMEAVIAAYEKTLALEKLTRPKRRGPSDGGLRPARRSAHHTSPFSGQKRPTGHADGAFETVEKTPGFSDKGLQSAVRIICVP